MTRIETFFFNKEVRQNEAGTIAVGSWRVTESHPGNSTTARVCQRPAATKGGVGLTLSQVGTQVLISVNHARPPPLDRSARHGVVQLVHSAGSGILGMATSVAGASAQSTAACDFFR